MKGTFEAVTGDACPPAGNASERASAVREAMEGLLQIRRLMNGHLTEPLSGPADWERRQPVRAVALILEAAGIPPSALDAEGRRCATGYCVRPGEQPGTVRVEWLGPPGSGAAARQHEALQRCARALEDAGWPALEYRGARKQRWLEAEPLVQRGR
ncbi:hypothetical protein [Streptomyces hiroshimensis]|uniref:Uncharacterized protein n=1 Tax=Streptomyces hiroshimensis TaxID=66424 RepID=A0ABQ2Z261_9ACTN|nr:hypothetical protein [Streptomyces hiroshimensis]GGY02591.1 hypothetical protein GCM10010324_56960 [Streptomyces hiroshimensis]